MQNLRDLKFKNYPFWRIDKRHLQIIDGGWHFSYLQTPNQILEKIKSFSHGEFNDSDLSEENIEKKIIKNEDIFNRGFKLKKIKLDETFQNTSLITKTSTLSGYLDFGAPDRTQPITSGAEIGALSS